MQYPETSLEAREGIIMEQNAYVFSKQKERGCWHGAEAS